MAACLSLEEYDDTQLDQECGLFLLNRCGDTIADHTFHKHNGHEVFTMAKSKSRWCLLEKVLNANLPRNVHEVVVADFQRRRQLFTHDLRSAIERGRQKGVQPLYAEVMAKHGAKMPFLPLMKLFSFTKCDGNSLDIAERAGVDYWFLVDYAHKHSAHAAVLLWTVSYAIEQEPSIELLKWTREHISDWHVLLWGHSWRPVGRL